MATRSSSRWLPLILTVVILWAVGLVVAAYFVGKRDGREAAIAVQTAPAVTVTPTVTAEPAQSAAEPVAEAPAADPAAAPQVGQPTTVDWGDGQGTVTIHTAEWVTVGVGEFSSPPKNGNYLVLDITIEAKAGTVPYNPLYFSLKNAVGQEFSGFVTNSGYEPSLQSGDLTAPNLARGFLSFDVAQGPVTVTLDDGFTDLATWPIR